jgi:hypothetical protein
MVIVEKLVEWRLAGATEVLGEKLSQRHFCPSQNPTWLDPVLNQSRRGGKPATNRLTYGVALFWGLSWISLVSSGKFWDVNMSQVTGACFQFYFFQIQVAYVTISFSKILHMSSNDWTIAI